MSLNKENTIENIVKIYKIKNINDYKNKYICNENTVNILLFIADWCGPCKRIKPQIKQEIIELQKKKNKKTN